MVERWVSVSGKDTAVSRPTSVLLITQDDAVCLHVTKALQDEHLIWGTFILQVEQNLPEKAVDLPDVILLDWMLVADKEFVIAILTEIRPIIFLLIDSVDMQSVLKTEHTEVYLLDEITSNSLPRIIKKTIQQTVLLQKERQQRVFAEAIHDISSSLNGTLDFNEVLDRILIQVGRVVPYDKVNIMLVDDASIKSVRLVGYENYPDVLDDKFNLTDSSIFAQIIKSQQGILISNVLEYPGWVNIIPTTRSWLCAPILLDDEVKAFICLDKKESNFYGTEHLEQLTIFAGQVAFAMGKAQLYAAAQRQLDELSALHALALATSEARDEDDFIARGTQIIGQSLYPDNFGVLLLDATGQNLITHPSYQVNKGEIIVYHTIPVTEGIVGYVARTGRPYHSSDITEDENYLLGSTQTRTEMCIPLFQGDKVIGVINAENVQKQAFTENDERLMITLAHQLSVGIERMRLFASERKRRREAEILREAAITLTAAKDIDTLLSKLLDFVTRFVTFDGANIVLPNEQNLLEIKAIRGYAGYDLDVVLSYTFEIDKTPTFKRIYETKRSYLIADTKSELGWEILPEVANVRSWLGVPFVVGEEVIGCYSLDKLEVDGFSDEDVRLAEALASQTAVSLQNIQLIQTTQRAVEESNIVNKIAQLLNAAPTVAENFPQLARSLQELTACHFMSLFLLSNDNSQGVIVALDDGIDGNPKPRQQINTKDSTTFATIIQGKVQITPDFSQELEGSPVNQMLYETGVRSSVNIPLKSANGVVGSLNIGWTIEKGYQARQIPLLTQIANAIAHTLERGRLFDEIKRWAHYLTTLHQFSHQITEEVDIESLCQTAVSFLHKNLNYLGVALFIVNVERSAVVLQASEGKKKELVPLKKYQQKFGEGIIGLVAQTEQMIHVPDTTQDANFLPSKRGEIKSEIAFPLHSNGQLLGVLNVDSDRTNAFSEEDIAILTIVSDQLAISLGNAVLFSETKKHVAEIEQRNQELIALNEVGKKLAATLDFPDIYRVMYDKIVAKTLQMSHFFVASYDENKKIFQHVFSIVEGEEVDLALSQSIPFGNQIMRDIVNTRQAKIIDLRLVSSDLESTILAPLNDEHNPLTAISAPLISGKRLLGVMIVQSYKADVFRSSDLTLLTTLANQASIAIENANLFIETNQRTAELEALFNLSTALRIASSSDDIFMEALRHVVTITGGAIGSIYLVELATGDFVEYGNYPMDVNLRGRRNKLNEGIVGHVAATGEIYITQDTQKDPLVKFSQKESSSLGHLRRSIHLPLKTQDSVVGVLNIGLIDQRVIGEGEIRLLTAVSEIVGSAIQRTLLVDSLEQHVADRTSELAYANERLKDLDRLKSKFVADVSHELRTPITNISLYLDLIAQGDQSKQERYLSVLRHQNDRLMNLIEDTLNLSRIELGKDKVTFHSFDLNEVTESVVAAHRPSAEAADLQLILDFDNRLPLMYGERNQMSQVVSNLLANAINYTLAGSVRVSTVWQPAEEEIWLTVSDTGIGINPEDQSHLFDRFYRGQEVSQLTMPGTGLGLAIVKEIVDIHAGKIVIESTPNLGTTFTIKLPIYS